MENSIETTKIDRIQRLAQGNHGRNMTNDNKKQSVEAICSQDDG